MKDIAIYIHEKTEAQQKRPATDGFLQIAACLNLITKCVRRGRRKRNLRLILSLYLKAANP
ncbi:MAG: hypothetical protein ACFNTA_00630 [Campylobacter sp.]|uniref:hypothetical protein n=1 Tax=Campylobacter sp. TaxID=205 RepID=UPI00361BC269